MSKSRLDTVYFLPPNVCPPLGVHPPLVSVPSFGYLRCFKLDFDAVKSQTLYPPLSVHTPFRGTALTIKGL